MHLTFCVQVHTSDVPILLRQVYGRIFLHFCTMIRASKHLSMIIDATSDRKKRIPLAMYLTGVTEEGCIWEKPIHFCEPPDHKATTQLREIEETFHAINIVKGEKDRRFVAFVLWGGSGYIVGA